MASDMKPVDRTTRGLAQALFEELESLRNGNSTPQAARAKASLANTICTISRLEMDFARFVNASRASDDNRDALKALPMA